MKNILSLIVLLIISISAIALGLSKMRAGVSAYYLDGVGACQKVTISGLHFTATGLNVAVIITANGSSKQLFTSRISFTQCGTIPIKFTGC